MSESIDQGFLKKKHRLQTKPPSLRQSFYPALLRHSHNAVFHIFFEPTGQNRERIQDWALQGDLEELRETSSDRLFASICGMHPTAASTKNRIWINLFLNDIFGCWKLRQRTGRPAKTPRSPNRSKNIWRLSIKILSKSLVMAFGLRHFKWNNPI